MPGVSADATEAALVEWAVEPGAAVKRGDVLASIETDKAVVELEAEEDAVLFRTLAVAGEMVPIGGPIAVLVQPGEDAQGEEAILGGLGLGPQASGPLDGADEERSQDALVPGAKPAEIEHTADDVVAGNGAARTRVFASPLARRLAVAAGLQLEDLEGTGPGGRIRRQDIEVAVRARGTAPVPAPVVPQPAAAPAQPAAASSGAGYTDIPHTRFRRAVAGALTASKQQVPHFYLKATCRVDRLMELRRQVNTQGGVRITINDFVVKAAALAMIEVPDMNVVWTADAVRRFDSVDIAVAVDSERGLMTPVVRGAQSRSLSDLSATIKDLAARAGAGTLKQQELEGGSLAISNLGMFGIEEFAAIIQPPQAGILAVGAVTSRPVQQDDGSVGFGQFLTVVLSADHRPVDGALAARWLSAFRELVENPMRLLV
jgi:pyruvate dehydrogenase E2 component (dihydrolipoamide acetyltransferase)